MYLPRFYTSRICTDLHLTYNVPGTPVYVLLFNQEAV